MAEKRPGTRAVDVARRHLQRQAKASPRRSNRGLPPSFRSAELEDLRRDRAAAAETLAEIDRELGAHRRRQRSYGRYIAGELSPAAAAIERLLRARTPAVLALFKIDKDIAVLESAQTRNAGGEAPKKAPIDRDAMYASKKVLGFPGSKPGDGRKPAAD